MAYIYQITNDINQKIYVGKTEFSIEKRFQQHCRDAFRNRNEKRPLYSAMKKYGIEHFCIDLIEETDNPNEREKYWIEQKQSFKNGYNATLGGDGKKYIDYDLVIASYNELQNQEKVATLLNISRDSVHNILSQYSIEIKTGEDVNREYASHIVNQYDLKGNYLRSFPSMAEAARSLRKYNSHGSVSHISDVCKGKRKTAYGYIWKYHQLKQE